MSNPSKQVIHALPVARFRERYLGTIPGNPVVVRILCGDNIYFTLNTNAFRLKVAGMDPAYVVNAEVYVKPNSTIIYIQSFIKN